MKPIGKIGCVSDPVLADPKLLKESKRKVAHYWMDFNFCIILTIVILSESFFLLTAFLWDGSKC